MLAAAYSNILMKSPVLMGATLEDYSQMMFLMPTA
jgi:hypothetical protein